MKLISLLLAMYMVVLSALPCKCADSCSLQESSLTHNQTSQKEKSHQDGCAALCNCTCCAITAYVSTHQYFREDVVVLSPDKSFSTFDQHYLSYNFQSIWQPPKLNC